MADIQPSAGNNYQVGPTTEFERALWNAVMASVGSRLTAREALEANFEALVAGGTQDALDLISQNVAPQLAAITDQITALAAEIEDIVGGGTAPNAVLLDNKSAAFYLALANATGQLPAAQVSGLTALLADAVTSAVTAIRDGAPDGLNTLAKLATALGSDANFSANVVTALAGKMRHGECQLVPDGTTVRLNPYDGDRLIIAGVERTIPAAGVAVALPLANTVYNVFAFIDGAALKLECSTTAYSRSTINGVMIKTGDETRTLVGRARFDTTYGLQQGSIAWCVRSWFHDRPVLVGGYNSGVADLSSGLQGSFASAYVLNWPGEQVSMEAGCSGTPLGSANSLLQYVRMNGAIYDSTTTTLQENYYASPKARATVTAPSGWNLFENMVQNNNGVDFIRCSGFTITVTTSRAN